VIVFSIFCAAALHNDVRGAGSSRAIRKAAKIQRGIQAAGLAAVLIDRNTKPQADPQYLTNSYITEIALPSLSIELTTLEGDTSPPA